MSDYKWTKPLVEHIQDLILKSEQDLAENKVQEWIYAQEAAKPQYMGRLEAEERLGLYQKHGKALEQKIALFTNYLKEHGNI